MLPLPMPDPNPVPDAGVEASSKPRLWSAISLSFVATAVAFLLMANQGQVKRGALLGCCCLVLSVAGILRAFGLLKAFDGPPVELRDTCLVALPGEARWIAPAFSVPLALGVLLLGLVVFGPGGLPWLIVAALAILVPASLRRPGLLVFVLVSALY